MYLSIPWYVWLIWLVILAASETSYVPQERLRLPPRRHSGSFSIKTGNLPHPLGYTRSQIKSLLYISFSLCNSSCRSVCFCIPKWLLEQQQATLQDKWGQAQCNFHINHSVSSLGWGEGEKGKREEWNDTRRGRKVKAESKKTDAFVVTYILQLLLK